MLNQFILQGRLTREPEGSQSSAGSHYTRFSIACKRDASKGITDFFDITAFGKNSEFVEKYCEKGKEVIVTGRMQMGTYEKDGKQIRKLSLIMTNINFVSSGSKKQEDDDDDNEQLVF